MKKIIFPFYNKYPKLGNLWWHRLLIFIFFVSIFSVFVFTWIGSNMHEISLRDQCLSPIYSNYTDSFELIKIRIHSCYEIFTVNGRDNFLWGLVAMIVANYLLQVIYYKIFLYIIFGNKLKDLK